MRMVLALAILGTAMLLPMAVNAEAPMAAPSPAFVRATACEAAAPIRTESIVQRRAVRANAVRKGSAVAAPAPEAMPEEVEDAPLLRRAVHFCAVTTSGRVYRT